MSRFIFLFTALLIFTSCNKDDKCSDDLQGEWVGCSNMETTINFFDDGTFDLIPLVTGVLIDSTIIQNGTYQATCEMLTLDFESGIIEYSIETMTDDLLELRKIGESNIECWEK